MISSLSAQRRSLGFLALAGLFVFWASPAHASLLIRPPFYIGLNSGLVGDWSFDQADMAGTVAYDRSGNNGDLTNGPQRTIGKIGQALSFDGLNRNIYVSIGTTNLDLTTKTLSAWIKMKHDPSGGTYRGIVITTPQSELYVLSDVFGIYDNNTGLFRSSGVNVADDQWHHVTTVYRSGVANGTELYVDGVLKANVTATNAGSVSAVDIGCGQGCSTQTFPGKIDDVRIYNRALSAQEVKRLYNMGGTLHVGASQNQKLTNGLVGLWSFDQADTAANTTYRTFYDRSGSGNNASAGTATGSKATMGKIGQGLNFDGITNYGSPGE